jgi:peptidyl-tRNA hydrolase, PTH1 family
MPLFLMNMKFLIVGLGNIGEEYANTRHNIGFVILDALARELEVTFSPGRYASVAEARYRGKTLILIKPSTYMNLSGKAVKYWLAKEKLLPENMLIIHDDKDLPPGSIRIRKNGSGGTHNGMNDIIYQLMTEDFPRLRFGIGNDFARGYQVDYVLGRWTPEEEKILIPRIPVATEVIKSFLVNGVDRTMNLYNNK